jgi:hypothetical protein
MVVPANTSIGSVEAVGEAIRLFELIIKPERTRLNNPQVFNALNPISRLKPLVIQEHKLVEDDGALDVDETSDVATGILPSLTDNNEMFGDRSQRLDH